MAERRELISLIGERRLVGRDSIEPLLISFRLGELKEELGIKN